MGNQCCLGVSERAVRQPYPAPLQLACSNETSPREASAPAEGDMDLVYAKPLPLKDLSSRLNIPQKMTNRSSEASLLRLNNDLTNMINTFEKAHGTIIGNELTRSNMVSSMKKIRELNDPAHDPLKRKKTIEAVPAANDDVPQKAVQELQLARVLAVSMQEPDNEVQADSPSQKISERHRSRVDSIQEQYSESSATCQDYYNNSGSQAEGSKNLLDAELVDEEVWRLQQDLYVKSSIVEGNKLSLWDIFDMDSVVLKVQNFSERDPTLVAAMACLAYYQDMFKITLPAFHRTTDSSVSVRIWINGTKRSLHLTDVPNTMSADGVLATAINRLYSNNSITRLPCYEVYHLSGWCPECLLMDQISNKDNLWERLAENFLQGNILITFGRRRQGQPEQFLTLKNVKKEESLLEVLCPGISPLTKQDTMNLCQVEWEKLNPNIDRIYINWNPSIYSYNKKFDSSWTARPFLPFQNQQICIGSNPQYLIRIPKHEQDFEIRVFADRHVSQFRTGQRLILKLFEYDGVRVMEPRNSIRSFESSQRQLLSDVFIFEKSEQVDNFVLVVMHGDQPIERQEQISFSLLFLSFIEVEVSELKMRETILTKGVSSALKQDNVGMGINSPNFPKNLHYSLQVPLGSDFQLFAETEGRADFMIVLLEDPTKTEDLLQINFQTVLADQNSTQLFHRYGFIEKQARVESYIVVVACFNAEGTQQLKLTANVVSKLHRRNRELQECYPPVLLKEMVSRPNIIKTHQVRWVKENTGQRKRLKNTTTPIYHPVSVFAEFLKNPCLQLKLARGRYQFNIVSDDYRKEFLSLTAYERQEKMLQPPALSLAILRLSDNEKGYKIILDDAFYVPIGYGFWSEELQLEQGRYTIVCPRLNHQQGRGTLSIRQL